MLDHPVVPLLDALILTILFLLCATALIGKIDPGARVKKTLTEGNVARALHYAADVLAIIMIATSATANAAQFETHGRAFAWAAAFGGAGTVVFVVLSRMGIRLLLQSKLREELDRGNVAAGVAAGGHSIATGIITAHALGGDSLQTLGLSVVFFTLGQVTLHLYVSLFRALTAYDDAAEVLGENLAAALSYAGMSIGLALIIGRALDGSFTGWTSSLKAYGLALLYGLGLIVARQVLLQTIILGDRPHLRGGVLDTAISRERNVAIGALEATVYIGAALCMARLG